MDYPKREKFFAMKFIRLMAKTCVANELGPRAFTLLSVVVTTEDAASYRRPVTFWDGQLIPLVGADNQKQLASTRLKCVQAGWLCYQHGTKGIPGRYFVTIPGNASNIDDYSSDEGLLCDGNRSGTDREQIGNESGTKTEQIGNENGTNRELIGEHSSLIPIPIPNKDSLSETDGGDNKPESATSREGFKLAQAQEFVRVWNMCGGVILCRRLTKKRIDLIDVRCRDPDWNWREALEKFPLKCFGGEGWRPDIDWFLKPDSALRVLEGKYDWVKSEFATSANPPKQTSFERNIIALQRFAESDENGIRNGNGSSVRLEADGGVY